MSRFARKHPDLDGLTITITAVCVLFLGVIVLYAVANNKLKTSPRTADTSVERHGATMRYMKRPYDDRWFVADTRTGRIAEFCDSETEADTLAAILNGAMSNAAAWRRLEDDVVRGER